MMHQEFERIAGYEVSFEDYANIIEPMYMATNLSKQDFVKVIDRKRFDLNEKKRSMIKEMRKIAEDRKANAEHTADWEAEDRLQELAHEYADTFHKGATPEIKRERTYRDFGCSYPCTLTIYGQNRFGWYEVENVKLA